LARLVQTLDTGLFPTVAHSIGSNTLKANTKRPSRGPRRPAAGFRAAVSSSLASIALVGVRGHLSIGAAMEIDVVQVLPKSSQANGIGVFRGLRENIL
jgi:hypothetical protein